jgi:homopolymeric O-antigen transport system permease protein
MSKVVYTSASRAPLVRLVAPHWILRDLMRHRELIRSLVRRDFDAAYRSTTFGVAWAVLNPLIMLAMFTLVFGYIFNGKFNPRAADETPAEFALALFVGLSIYNCVGQALTASPGIILSNSAYLKTLSFPLEVLPLAATLNQLLNAVIGLALCLVAFAVMHRHVHPTAIWIVAHVICVGLIALGLSWFLSSVAVFVRDIPSITSPLSIVLMFMSSVFFPVESVPPRIAFLFKANPIAILVDQSRGALLYGRAPDLPALGLVFVFAVAVAIGGYWFFNRTKAAFADVI